jgi:AAHS family 4-hydroxybenzoate transporter-like MFS transporter
LNNPINVSDIIDNSKIGRFQVATFVLCAPSLIMDGFDVQAMGFVGPEFNQEWGLTGAQFGQILAATNFGVLIDSLLFTMLTRVGDFSCRFSRSLPGDSPCDGPCETH